MNEKILDVKALHKKFGAFTALHNVQFQLEKGTVYGLLGPNGSGKSTTLGILLHVINKTSGSFSWFGKKDSDRSVLQQVGATIERPNFYPYLSAYDNLKIVCKIKQIPTDNIAEKLHLVGLWDRKDTPFSGFSLGMKQRLAIASALLNNPEILILDEPTNGLDPQGIRQIRDLIIEIAQSGTTILLASHLLDEVEKVCTHVIVLQKGKMLFQGSVASLLQQDVCYEIGTDLLENALSVLEKNTQIIKIEKSEVGLLVYTQKDFSAAQLNEFLSKKGVYVHYLSEKKQRLEDQFLQLIQNQN